MTGQDKVLVDSGEFKIRMEELVVTAKKSIYVQSMSFEGDDAGEWLIGLLIAADAPDIQLCLDSYSKFVVNDHFVYSLKYLRDGAFRKEVKNTRTILDKAKAHGIKVKFTNPLGFLFLKYPWRNHKKLVVIDEEVAFVGGINFCGHNFSWHDMMVEIDDQTVCASLASDFRATIKGKNESNVVHSDASQIYFLNGLISKEYYDDIFDVIKNAKRSVQIFSPYVSDPLLGFLKKEVPDNIALDIISPEKNNKNIFKTILSRELMQGYFKLYQYNGRMSHLKAILVDDETLIAGSSNFDFVSYYFEQEVVFVTKDDKTVKDFIRKIALPDIANSTIMLKPTTEVSNFIPLIFKAISKIAYMVALLTSGILMKKSNRPNFEKNAAKMDNSHRISNFAASK